jgi:hypothetical protein
VSNTSEAGVTQQSVELTGEEISDLVWALELRVQDELRMAHRVQDRDLARRCQEAAVRLDALIAKLGGRG